jgi:hypothetical protein
MKRGGSRLARTIARGQSEDGQALVEFALILPLLLILLLGILDFGRAINYWNAENHLAEVGARYAAVGNLPGYGPCLSNTTIVTYVQCEAGLDSPELQHGSTSGHGVHNGIQVCVSVPSNTEGAEVTVQVYATYNWLPLVPAATTTLIGQATMRLEAPMPTNWWTTTGNCSSNPST